MKKILFIFSALITMLFFTETVGPISSASSPDQISKHSKNNFYAFRPVNKTITDENSIKYTVLGYQYLKDPIPPNHQARFLLIKCQINTDDLDPDMSPSLYNDFAKVYDNHVKAMNASNILSEKRMKCSPFKPTYDDNTYITAKPNKTYKFNICVVVYPYDDIELQLHSEYDHKQQTIAIHKVKSSNGITMNDKDSLKDYNKENKTNASNN